MGMGGEQVSGTDEALAALERPYAHLYEVRGEPLWARLYATEALHRLAPAPVGVGLASLAGRLAWHREAPREEALARARVFTGSADPRELKRFTRRHLREYRIQDELFWRPWLVPKMRIEGVERLQPERGGAIVAGIHIGSMWALQMALALRVAEAGRHLYISRWQKVEAERISTGARAHYVPRKIARLEKAGARFVGRGGSYPLIRELLGRGETCWLAIDTVATGRGRETTLAGRRVRLATGLASLALETGVPVIPAFAYRDRWRPAARLLDPVDPTGFDDLDSLHEHLARIASDAIEERRAEIMPDLALALEWGGP